MRTIYLSEDMDKYITERMQLEDRKRSSLIERMLKKCLQQESNADKETISMGQ